MDWLMYILVSANSRRTYVGVTNNFPRRIRQHNGELKGGAKATRAESARPWVPLVHVCGLDKRSALRLEWRMHHCRKGRGIKGRVDTLYAAVHMIELPPFQLKWFMPQYERDTGFLPDSYQGTIEIPGFIEDEEEKIDS
jgi:predicted GIY-YIG superfamily endonuclease